MDYLHLTKFTMNSFNTDDGIRRATISSSIVAHVYRLVFQYR